MLLFQESEGILDVLRSGLGIAPVGPPANGEVTTAYAMDIDKKIPRLLTH